MFQLGELVSGACSLIILSARCIKTSGRFRSVVLDSNVRWVFSSNHIYRPIKMSRNAQFLFCYLENFSVNCFFLSWCFSSFFYSAWAFDYDLINFQIVQNRSSKGNWTHRPFSGVVCCFGVLRPTREFYTHMETSLSSEGSLACHTYCRTELIEQ